MNLALFTSPIVLKEHQKNHVDRTWTTLQKNFSYGDVSTTGLGKTHTTLAISWLLQKNYGMKTVIVASNKQSLYGTDSWDTWKTKYEIDVVFMKTYSELIQRNSKTYHSWLVYDPLTRSYSATEKFEALAKQGIFLVFDEFHKATRDSEAHKACAALVRSCHRNKKQCRVGLLSFTPGDAPEHYPQILRMLGIIQHPAMSKYDRSTRTHYLDDYGFGDLVKYCKKLDPNFNLKKFLNDKPTVPRIRVAAQQMYHEYVHPHITLAMPKPDKLFKVEMLNMFLETKPEDLEVINKGITLLSSSVRWNNGQVGDGQWDLGGVFIGLRVIEQGKLNLFAKYIRMERRRYPNKKFIVNIGSKSLLHQTYLQENLSVAYIPDKMYIALRLALKYNPMWKSLGKDVFNMICNYLSIVIRSRPVIMNGKTPQKERKDIIDQFQAPTNDIWCLILSPGVGGESISLHDQHGNHPRDILISPEFHHTRMVQTAGRTDRVGAKSACKIVMIYSKEANLETSILDSMARKSKTAKDLLTKEQKEKFPAEYDYFIEGDRDHEIEMVLDRMRNNNQ